MKHKKRKQSKNTPVMAKGFTAKGKSRWLEQLKVKVKKALKSHGNLYVLDLPQRTMATKFGITEISELTKGTISYMKTDDWKLYFKCTDNHERGDAGLVLIYSLFAELKGESISGKVETFEVRLSHGSEITAQYFDKFVKGNHMSFAAKELMLSENSKGEEYNINTYPSDEKFKACIHEILLTGYYKHVEFELHHANKASLSIVCEQYCKGIQDAFSAFCVSQIHTYKIVYGLVDLVKEINLLSSTLMPNKFTGTYVDYTDNTFRAASVPYNDMIRQKLKVKGISDKSAALKKKYMKEAVEAYKTPELTGRAISSATQYLALNDRRVVRQEAIDFEKDYPETFNSIKEHIETNRVLAKEKAILSDMTMRIFKIVPLEKSNLSNYTAATRLYDELKVAAVKSKEDNSDDYMQYQKAFLLNAISTGLIPKESKEETDKDYVNRILSLSMFMNGNYDKVMGMAMALAMTSRMVEDDLSIKPFDISTVEQRAKIFYDTMPIKQLIELTNFFLSPS